jgi:hypothetical protein
MSAGQSAYAFASHTALSIKKLIQKTRIAPSDGKVSENSVNVVFTATDADGAVYPNPISIKATVRVPRGAQSSEVDAALAAFRDVIAGDEFTDTVDTFNPLVSYSG